MIQNSKTLRPGSQPRLVTEAADEVLLRPWVEFHATIVGLIEVIEESYVHE